MNSEKETYPGVFLTFHRASKLVVGDKIFHNKYEKTLAIDNKIIITIEPHNIDFDECKFNIVTPENSIKQFVLLNTYGNNLENVCLGNYKKFILLLKVVELFRIGNKIHQLVLDFKSHIVNIDIVAVSKEYNKYCSKTDTNGYKFFFPATFFFPLYRCIEKSCFNTCMIGTNVCPKHNIVEISD